MGYRPDGWAKIKRDLCQERLKSVGGAHCETCPAEPLTCDTHGEKIADAMLDAIWKLANESPTKTFTFDANVINIFGESNA